LSRKGRVGKTLKENRGKCFADKGIMVSGENGFDMPEMGKGKGGQGGTRKIAEGGNFKQGVSLGGQTKPGAVPERSGGWLAWWAARWRLLYRERPVTVS